MRKLVIKSFLFAFIGLILGSGAASGQQLREILNRIDAHNKALLSVQADVTMEKYNPQLDAKDIYIGSTSYLPENSKFAKGKMYMRLDWTKPAVEQISLIGNDYMLYKPSINQVYIGKKDKAKTSAAAGNALGFMNMNKTQLKANYDVTFVGEEKLGGVTPTFRLLLTPKATMSYKSAELWVDGDGMPLQAKIVEMNNDVTTVMLANVRKNVGINTAIFKLNVPGNAKKVHA